MIRKHLNPPKQNNKQILEKTNKNFAKVDIYQFLLSYPVQRVGPQAHSVFNRGG